METLIETTTGHLASSNLFTHCGDYAGEFQDDAYDILTDHTDLEDFENEQWADIMFNQNNKVYAIWANGPLTFWNSQVKMIELDYDDCPAAFDGMKSKTNY